MKSEQPEALRLADEMDSDREHLETSRSSIASELRRLHAENEALRAQLSEKNIGQGEPVGTAISYYTEDGHTKWTFQPTKLGWEMPQDSRANERGARSCFDVYAHSAQQASVVAFCTYPKCQTTGMKCAGQCSQASVVQQEHVGVVGEMPGTSGFTMACFHADNVPVGSKLYTHPAPQQKPLTGEQDRALCEAYCNAASDEYFKARPQLDSSANRRIFYAGHRKAWIEWKAAHHIGEKK